MLRSLVLLSLAAPLMTACGVGVIAAEEEGQSEDALRQCADGPTLPGLDVSYAQSKVDWAAVKGSGKVFAFIRVSDGAERGVDVQFAANWAGAEAQGIYRGAYQYFRPSQDPIAQADLMLAQLGSRTSLDLPPALDLEDLDGQKPAVVVARARAWIDHVRAALGRQPIVYISPGFSDRIRDPIELASSELWVANWTTKCPKMPLPWSAWRFWQSRVASGSPGIRTAIDLDVFNGTQAELAELAER